LDNETESDQTVTYNVGPDATFLTTVVPARANRIVCANDGTVYGNVTKIKRAGCGGGIVTTVAARETAPTTTAGGGGGGGGAGDGGRSNDLFIDSSITA
jgi:hypothetical protein